MFRFRRILKTAWPRRGVALLVALAYGYLCAGVPIPSVAKRSAERFPCEHCACGCDSAEQCWTHCCCHTPAERLAWAEREGVTPPAYVLAQLEAETAKPACCQKQNRCCTSIATNSCCSKEVAKDTKDRGVVGWRALECQGHKAGWLVATPTVVAAIHPVVISAPRITWLGPLGSDHAPTLSYPPVEPPPRLLVG